MTLPRLGSGRAGRGGLFGVLVGHGRGSRAIGRLIVEDAGCTFCGQARGVAVGRGSGRLDPNDLGPRPGVQG
jgi:hypothetical protein